MQKMEQKSPERMKKMMDLKDDPELKDVFQDIASNGPAAMEKYWNDTDLMSKIAKKMSALNVGPDTPPRTGEASSSKVGTMLSSDRDLSPLSAPPDIPNCIWTLIAALVLPNMPVYLPGPVLHAHTGAAALQQLGTHPLCTLHATVLTDSQAAPQTLHEAAKVGDEAALQRLIGEGQDVDAKDRRGITALGVAVGFNRIPCVCCLLDAGADVHLTDARRSTVLHYAAGISL